MVDDFSFLLIAARIFLPISTGIGIYLPNLTVSLDLTSAAVDYYSW